MEVLDRLYNEILVIEPAVKDSVIRHLTTGDFKFAPDSVSIATIVLHIFPDCHELSHISYVDDSIEKLKMAYGAAEGFKSSNGNQYNAWRHHVTYTKALCAKLLKLA